MVVNIKKVIAIVLITFMSGVQAETNLEDLTMQVIDLEEIPKDSFHIELPHSTLEDMAGLNKATVPSKSPVGDAMVAPDPSVGGGTGE